MTQIAASFTWPFRARLPTWIGGALAVVLLPVAFVPLLGYAVQATRANDSPPRWSWSWRLLSDGSWMFLAVAATLLPFALVLFAASRVIGGIGLVVVFFALALPWGVVALLWLPCATAAFAATGKPRDLFDVGASLRGVGRDFATWNVAVAAIVSAWAVALACAGLLCIGVFPGIFYAILVSAHATATLARPRTEAPPAEAPHRAAG